MSIQDWVSKWEALALPVDGHRAVKDGSNLDKALFGLWAIRRSLGESGKEVSRLKLCHFLWAAFEIRVNDRSLEDALKSKMADGKVERVKGVTFQILPPGMDYAQGLADACPIALAPPTP